MGREAVIARAAVPRCATILITAFLCAFSAGCGNSCFLFVSNPSGGTLSINADGGACRLTTQPVGNVRIRFRAPSDRSESWREAGIEHVFLTVREIDAHLGLAYGEESSGWQDMTPNLNQRPLQIDLMSGPDNASPPGLLAQATIPAGEYTQVRILLRSDHFASEAAVREANACGEAQFNCVITQDGNVHPLILSGGEQTTGERTTSDRILISAGQPARAVFCVFRGATSNLDLEFDPASSQIYMLGSAAWLHPSFITGFDFSPAPGDNLASPVTVPAAASLAR
jgi:hypothetical protein